jgi:hypothetical protein
LEQPTNIKETGLPVKNLLTSILGGVTNNLISGQNKVFNLKFVKIDTNKTVFMSSRMYPAIRSV